MINNTIKRLLIKSKLFAPIGIAIILSILTITLLSIKNSKNSIYNLLENNLLYEVETIKHFLNNERDKKTGQCELLKFNELLGNFYIGERASLFILSNDGQVIISSSYNKDRHLASEFVKTILREHKGKIRYSGNDSNLKQIITFDYAGDLEFYIVATVSQIDETQPVIQNIVKQSVISGVAIFIVLSLFVFFLTTDKLHRYLKQIEDSNKKLLSTREALEYSEDKFKTLFNNSSDEVFVTDFKGNIIEVNLPACESLEYTREELLRLRLHDIKTSKSKQFVSANLKTVIEKGFHINETEHVSKSGKVMLFEMKSRIIEYEGKKLVLSIARNISDRKVMEKKLIQTIIETEVKERKRFSADLHDGLGPILSTIKLYSDLIKKGNFNKISLEEAVINIDELVEHAITSAKEISNNITPNVLEDFGLAVAINEFCSYLKRTQSINIEADTLEYTIQKTGIETTILYQTVKELINNTLKHAQAQNIKIQLKNINNQILLYYRDDGEGFDMEEKLSGSGGLGLNNIMNKIKTLKGTCDFNCRKGKGMFVLISVKMEEENSN